MSREPSTRLVWIATVALLVAAWTGLSFAGGNQAYVVALIMATIWLPAFAWWSGRHQALELEDDQPPT